MLLDGVFVGDSGSCVGWLFGLRVPPGLATGLLTGDGALAVDAMEVGIGVPRPVGASVDERLGLDV